MKPLLKIPMMTAALILPAFILASGCAMHSKSSDNAGSSGGRTSSAMSDALPTNNANGMTNSEVVNPDNSQKNARDQSGTNLTVLDQGSSAVDVQLTRQIRQSVVSKTNDFSMMAQNIKIITINGKVTLRGPVQTDMEKSTIEAIARSAAGDGNVNDLLEVKNNQ